MLLLRLSETRSHGWALKEFGWSLKKKERKKGNIYIYNYSYILFMRISNDVNIWDTCSFPTFFIFLIFESLNFFQYTVFMWDSANKPQRYFFFFFSFNRVAIFLKGTYSRYVSMHQYFWKENTHALTGMRIFWKGYTPVRTKNCLISKTLMIKYQ